MELKLSLCALTALFSFTNSINAQTAWSTQGPYGGAIRAVKTLGNNMYAGTANGVFKSTNNGQSWAAVNSGLETIQVNDLALKGGNIFAATETQGVYYSSNGGTSWAARNNGISSTNIISVFASSNGIFAGTPDGVYFTATNGSLWTLANTGIPEFYSIHSWAQMGDTVYGGTLGEGCYMTTNNGNTWTKVGGTFPEKPTGTYVYALYSSDNMIYAGTNAGVYRSTDRGVTWSNYNTGFPQDIRAKCFITRAGSVFAGTHSEGVMVTSDTAASWIPANNGFYDWPKNNGLPHNYHAVNALAAKGSTVFAATFDGMYRTANNGTSWTDSNTGILATDVMDIASNGNYVFAGTNFNGMYVSPDQGLTWNRANNGLTYEGVSAVTAKKSVLFAAAQNLKVVRSVDNGATWVPANNGLLYEARLLESDTMQVLATGGSFREFPKLYQTLDNGANWTRLRTDTIAGTITALHIKYPYIYAGTSWGKLHRTSDNGGQWQDISTNLPALPITCITTINNDVYVGTDGSGVYKLVHVPLLNTYLLLSSNSGISNNSIRDLKTSGSTMYAATWGGGVYTSTNTALSWIADNSGLTNPFVKSLSCDDSNIYAATGTGAYQGGTPNGLRIANTTGIEEESSWSVNVYPNPSSGLIHLALDGQHANIHVYNITGTEVYKTTDAVNEVIDLSGLPKGIYFMNVQTNQNAVTKKIVIR